MTNNSNLCSKKTTQAFFKEKILKNTSFEHLPHPEFGLALQPTDRACCTVL